MLACILVSAGVTSLQALAQDQAAPPLVKQINNGNWLPQREAEALRDELFYQRAKPDEVVQVGVGGRALQ